MGENHKLYILRRQAADLGDEARRQYMCYLAAKKRWLAKVDELAAVKDGDNDREQPEESSDGQDKADQQTPDGSGPGRPIPDGG